MNQWLKKSLKDNRIKYITIILLVFTSMLSCNSEEDSYISTELSGLYKYKTAYMKDNCSEGDTGYTTNIEDELPQPYFLLEGRRGYDDSSHDILSYDCTERRFDKCIKLDEYGYEIENVIATGYDRNWKFKNTIATEYDYLRKECVFKMSKLTKYTLPESPMGIDDLLETEITYYSYRDKNISIKNCRVNETDYSNFACISKKKYLSQRIVLNEKDQEYFDEKNKLNQEE